MPKPQLAIRGTGRSNTLFGNDQSNTIFGLNGNDVIYGLGGDDTLIGGPGDDLLDGGDGIDQANYQYDPAGIVVTFTGTSSGTVLDGYGNLDTFVNLERVLGSPYDDTFYGSFGSSNVFIGLQGNDTFYGTPGQDTNPDTVDYSFDVLFGATQGVRVNQDGGHAMGGLAPDTATDSFGDTDYLPDVRNVTGTQFDDIFYGGGHGNRIEAGGGNDFIYGFDGDDRLFGQAGNDWIEGGAGQDQVSGGTGNDTFVLYAPTGFDFDSIADFTSGEDTIAVHAGDYGLSTGQLSSNHFEAGTVATLGTPEFLYDASSATLYWDSDGAAGGAVSIATFEQPVDLHASDIQVVV